MNAGRKHSEESKQRAIDTKKQNGTLTHSEETKNKISISHKGKKHSIETKQKLSKIKAGIPGQKWNDERKQKYSKDRTGCGNPMYGKANKDFMTEEEYEIYRKHLSESLMGHAVSDETKKKISEKSKINSGFIGGRNPKAKQIICIEDNITFETLKDCAEYYNIPRYKMTSIAKDGFYDILNKHFIIKNNCNV